MAKHYYETLLLCTTAMSAEEQSQIESTLASMLKKESGTITKFDVWGKYRLAYAVKKNEYGTYILARYELDGVAGSFFAEFENFLRVKCNDFVMRYVNKALTPDQYTRPYTKPESLDVRSDSGTGSFGRDKVGGFRKSHALDGDDESEE